MKKFGKTLSLTLLLALSIFSILSEPLIPVVNSQVEGNGNISFMPNVVPFLTVTDRPVDKPESFRFEWLGNMFDVELFFNATYNDVTRLFSLRDFEDDFNVTVSYTVNRNESVVQFGWFLENVEDVSGLVHEAWLKIEDTEPFDYDEIELEQVEIIDLEESYNVTRFHLPDNLVLSFEDIGHKGFVVGKPVNNMLDKTWDTKVHGDGFKNEKWNLDPITYSAPTITVIGGTEGSELTFLDIWNADQSGGWNVVHNNNNTNTQFQFSAKLVFGNGTVAGTTWFADENVQVNFEEGIVSVNHEYLIEVKPYANFRLGNLINDAEKETKYGCSLCFMETSYYIWGLWSRQVSGSVELYSTQIFGKGTSYRLQILIMKGKIYNCIFSDCYIGLQVSSTTYGTADLDVYRFTMTYGYSYSNGLYVYQDVTIDDLTIKNFYRAIVANSNPNVTISNLHVRNVNSLFLANYYSGNFYLVDTDSDAWTFEWATSPNAKVYRQYTLDLTVTDNTGTAIQNANVTITYEGQGGGTVGTWLTDSDGQIPQQTLSRSFYNQTGDDTEYPYYPFQLTITKDGYDTYTQKWTPTEKEHRRLALAQNTQPGWTLAFVFVALLICVPLGLIFFIRRRR